MLSLLKSLRLHESPRVAFVGAGGKTTAMFSLAHQIHTPVLVTATTHMGSWELSLADSIIIIGEKHSFENRVFKIPGDVTLLIGPEVENNRHIGLSGKKILEIITSLGWDKYPLLIESDGSRKRPLKAPADNEPVIPGFVDIVVVVAGMHALWKPLSNYSVHRVEEYSCLSGISPGELIDPESIIRVLEHHSGGLKNIPKNARKILLLNQADTAKQQDTARDIAQKLLSSYECVIIASLNPDGRPDWDIEKLQDQGKVTLDYLPVQRINREQVITTHERIVGIVLAAGESHRFGQPKQMMDWNGIPMLRHIVNTALASQLSEILVITGAHAEEVSRTIEDMPVVKLHNSNWQEGQSASIRLGLENISEEINAVLFILADQPYLDTDLINALVYSHQSTLAPIIAPIVGNQRGNPVLFDRITFSNLKKLTGNQGGRDIFDRYKLNYVEWDDPNILTDIDTLEDYLRLEQN